MNKMHAALCLLTAALTLGWLLKWTAPNDTAPANLPTETQKKTNNPPTLQNMPPAMVATETDRPNAAAATPLMDRVPLGESSPQPRSIATAAGVHNSTLAWPTSPPQPTSSCPAANTTLSAPVAVPGASSVVVDQEILVPRGEPVPAAIMDEGYGASAEQVQSLDDIAEEFLDNALSSESAAQADMQSWRDAARLADERYRSMFGIEAFNRWSMEAAKEVLAEKSHR